MNNMNAVTGEIMTATVSASNERREHCSALQSNLLSKRDLIIVANRGPVTLQNTDVDNLQFHRGGGGLVTALIGLGQQVQATWIACAASDLDREWKEGLIPLYENGESIRVNFILPDEAAYQGYYDVISNPLLWFLQHKLWDYPRSPTIDRATWKAWEEGYTVVNQMFAEAIVRQINKNTKPTLVMLQDYHLYLIPGMLRKLLPSRKKYTLSFFVHIPWPGPADWDFLPPTMRRAILESLCAVDLLGFQTERDTLNFIRTCESHLPRAFVNYRHGRIWFRNHATYVRDFPISIDVDALRQLAETDEVAEFNQRIQEIQQECKLILRVDRTEPSKNIVRGFQAFDELLELYPEHHGKVIFLAILSPSRLEVEEYKNYLDEFMAIVGQINARYGNPQWEPVRVLIGEDYSRAVASMQLYDVLLVNSIADGMNLVAKEGPIVNKKNGVVILSERTGARQQLEPGAIVISPCDVYATAQAMHQALVMPETERQERAERLAWIVEREDITDWLCRQLENLVELGL